MEISAMVQTSPLVAQSSRWKMCWCISKPTSSENTFEEIFYCAKYLRAILLITYLFLYGYDCTDSTLTNMNEWIHEERRVMCYIPHQEWSTATFFFFFFFFWKSNVYFRHISVVPGICSMGWNINHSASLWKKFSALSQRLYLISVSTNSSVFWLSVSDTAKHRIHRRNKCLYQKTLISDTVTSGDIFTALLVLITHLKI